MRYYQQTVIPEIETDQRDMVEVYFMESGNFIKIGVSRNTHQRLHSVEAHNPNVSLLGYVPGTFDLERYLHRAYASSRHRREWFRQTPKMLDEIPALLACGVAYGVERYGWSLSDCRPT